MSKKVNWAEVDKRIRDRKRDWTGDEMKALQANLEKLPDRADAAEAIEIAQPALASSESEEGEEASEEPAAEG